MNHNQERISALFNLLSKKWTGVAAVSVWFGMDSLVHSRLQPHSGNAKRGHGASVQASRSSYKLPGQESQYV